MSETMKNHWVKLLGMLMVTIALGAVFALQPPSVDAQECLPNCPPCAWCTFWNGGPVCLQEGQHSCYYGNYLVCQCSDGNCSMTYVSSC